jgi:hypothetical protein
LNIADDSASKCHLVQTIREETKGVKLEDAKIIVTGGGGKCAEDLNFWTN